MDNIYTFIDFLNMYLKKRNLNDKFFFYYTRYNITRNDKFSKSFIKNAVKTKARKDVFLVIDLSTEGFSLYENRYYDVIYNFCKTYDISEEKIIFVSSNLKEDDCLNLYNNKNNIKNSINVFSFLFFKFFSGPTTTFTEMQKDTVKKFKNKYFLSLSRVNRKYRSLMQYQIYNNDLADCSIQSHDILKKEEQLTLLDAFSINKKSFKKWTKNLPLIADYKTFKVNYAYKFNKNLYQKTLFEIANETKVDNYNNTSLFYSEKTFKPMHNFQPFLIYGQQYCNQKLEDYGFKLYRNHFNYDFDNEPDNFKRCLMLVEETKRICNLLDNMNKEEKIAWKYQDEKTLLHNNMHRYNHDLEENIFNKLIDKLCFIANKTE